MTTAKPQETVGKNSRKVGSLITPPTHTHLSHAHTGTYTYPISFTIPGNMPPTLHCDWGWVVWCLKARVHRPGAFTTKLTATRQVNVISYPIQDDIEEQSSIIVQRQWENQLHYLICISAKIFYIGGTIPIQFTFLPIAKVKIHKIVVFIDGKFKSSPK